MNKFIKYLLCFFVGFLLAYIIGDGFSVGVNTNCTPAMDSSCSGARILGPSQCLQCIGLHQQQIHNLLIKP